MIQNFFLRYPLPKTLPKEMEGIIKKLKKTKSKEECLKKTHTIMTKRFKGCKIWEEILNGFETNSKRLWEKKSTHCTNLNYLVRTLLIKSGHFKEQDIRRGYSLALFLSPHQYLKVRIKNKWHIVDLWAGTRGVKLGDYMHGFHTPRWARLFPKSF